jgi:hypothetical protein
MSNSGHDQGSQQTALDTYIAMVKYRPNGRRESNLRVNTLSLIFYTIETQHY